MAGALLVACRVDALLEFEDLDGEVAVEVSPPQYFIPERVLTMGSARAPRGDERVSAAGLREHVLRLSHDSMRGRAPLSEGERAATSYVVSAFSAIGLAPGGDDGGWTQGVPVRRVSATDTRVSLSFVDGEGAKPRGRLARATTTALVPAGSVELFGGRAGKHEINATLAFAGYGVEATADLWNDYRDVDLSDAIAVVLAGAPPVEDARLSSAEASLHGRDARKIEAARRAGARGCLIVTTDDAFSPRPLHDARGDGPGVLAAHVTTDFASALASRSGSGYSEWLSRARAPGFHAIKLPVALVGEVELAVEQGLTPNVVGVLAGRSPELPPVVVTAHWDHRGVIPGRGLSTDAIFNGAVDGASGLAAMLGLAYELKQQLAGEAALRSIVFVATTAREHSRLGSRYFLEHQQGVSFALDLGSMRVNGDPGAIVLAGATRIRETPTLLAGISAPAGTRLHARALETRFSETDAWTFASAGLPAVYALDELFTQDKAADGLPEFVRVAGTVNDEFDHVWSFSALEEDVRVLAELVRAVADLERAPSIADGARDSDE
ncbi:MAG: M28 family peptidase [Myxococcales bacterium]|nr:M28 family peptidase [Myxococcales bacterium]